MSRTYVSPTLDHPLNRLKSFDESRIRAGTPDYVNFNKNYRTTTKFSMYLKVLLHVNLATVNVHVLLNLVPGTTAVLSQVLNF